jgi:hypothetical protein
LCFAIHLGGTVHHTYFTASARDTRSFPHPRSIAEPRRWHNFLDLNRWDSAHYERIVLEGYRNREHPDRPLSTMLWYPGYPLLAKAIFLASGARVTLIFSLLSASLTLAFWLLLWTRGSREIFGARAVAVASVLVLCWPGSFYWFAGMTEPLVALLLLAVLLAWFRRHPTAMAGALGYATSVKQVFLPAALAMLALDLVQNRPRFAPFAARTALALAGFLAFGIYSRAAFGSFTAPSDLVLRTFHIEFSLLGIFDVPNYLRHLGDPSGLATGASMAILALLALRLPRHWRAWRASPETPRALPVGFVLWWLALAYTTSLVAGKAYASDPFASMLRYQTANVPLFLLVAQELSQRRLALLLAPVALLLLAWQQRLAVLYWSWSWIG